MVVRKHLLENGSQKARHREWKECFLVVGHGELKMYSVHGHQTDDRRSMLRANSVSSFATLADSLGSNTPTQTSPWAVSVGMAMKSSIDARLRDMYSQRCSYWGAFH